MHFSLKRIRLIILIYLATALFTLAFIFSSCEKSEPGSANQQPVFGGSLKVVSYRILTLDPVKDLSVYESFVINQLYEGLVELDEGMNPVPGLAEFWTIDSAFTSFTFQLRPHVAFHNGEILTAEEVLKSFENLIKKDASRSTAIHHFIEEIVGVREWLAGKSPTIRGITIPDGSHIQFKLRRSIPDFLYFFATDQAKILITDQSSPDTFIGAGPFTLDQRTDSCMTLLPFRHYFRGRPYLDSIIITFDEEDLDETSVDELLAGSVNLIECPLPAIDSLSLRSDLHVQKRLALGFEFLGLRLDRPPLRDRNFRKLLAQTIDWSRLDTLAAPYFRRAQGVIPPGMEGFRPNLINPAREPEYQPGPEKTVPKKFTKPLVYGVTSSLVKGTENDIIYRGWSGLGIPIIPNVLNWTDFDNALEIGGLDFFMMGWIVEIPSTSRYLYNLFHTKGVGNYFGYSNPNVDRLIEKALSTTDKSQQIVLCQTVEDSILQDIPLIPLNFVFNAFAYNSHMHGFKLSEMGLSTLHCEELWFDGKGDNQ